MKTATPSRRAGFTLVELLLAMALGVLVAAILGALIHSLLSAGEGQFSRTRGAYAARSALRVLSRDLACAYAPPVKELQPMELSTSTEPGKPLLLLSFYAPVNGPVGPDMEQVTYAVEPAGRDGHALQRISSPCIGPGTNAPVTNSLLTGRFTFSAEAIVDGEPVAVWPQPGDTETGLPRSMRLTLNLQDSDPMETEVLIQTANNIPSPLKRDAAPAENEEEPAPPEE